MNKQINEIDLICERMIGDPALPFHINSKETFDLIGGIGIVWWMSWWLSLNLWVMGGATRQCSAKRRKQANQLIQIKLIKERERMNEDKAKVNLLMEWKNWVKSINERCLCFGGMNERGSKGSQLPAASHSATIQFHSPALRDWNWLNCWNGELCWL